MKKAIYPGSFNPFHEGHISILKKALKIFDFVYVVVSTNEWKENQGGIKLRWKAVKGQLANFKNIEVLLNDNSLTTDFAKKLKTNFIIRSGRDNVDFEYERNLAFLYQKSMPEIEVIIIMPEIKTLTISSSDLRKIKDKVKI